VTMRTQTTDRVVPSPTPATGCGDVTTTPGTRTTTASTTGSATATQPADNRVEAEPVAARNSDNRLSATGAQPGPAASRSGSRPVVGRLCSGCATARRTGVRNVANMSVSPVFADGRTLRGPSRCVYSLVEEVA